MWLTLACQSLGQALHPLSTSPAASAPTASAIERGSVVLGAGPALEIALLGQQCRIPRMTSREDAFRCTGIQDILELSRAGQLLPLLSPTPITGVPTCWPFQLLCFCHRSAWQNRPSLHTDESCVLYISTFYPCREDSGSTFALTALKTPRLPLRTISEALKEN